MEPWGRLLGERVGGSPAPMGMSFVVPATPHHAVQMRLTSLACKPAPSTGPAPPCVDSRQLLPLHGSAFFPTSMDARGFARINAASPQSMFPGPPEAASPGFECLRSFDFALQPQFLLF